MPLSPGLARLPPHAQCLIIRGIITERLPQELRWARTASQKVGFWGAAAIVQPSGAGEAAVTLGNTDGAIGGLSIGAAYSQAEVQALRDKCEQLADDAWALSPLIHGLRTALLNAGLVKGGA